MKYRLKGGVVEAKYYPATHCSFAYYLVETPTRVFPMDTDQFEALFEPVPETSATCCPTFAMERAKVKALAELADNDEIWRECKVCKKARRKKEKYPDAEKGK